jgi:ABC-type ATPase with predicted acetyltransferase domain
MIDIACFCGASFSFDGDLGACPGCGHVVNLAGSFPAAERLMLEELERLALEPRAGLEVPSPAHSGH